MKKVLLVLAILLIAAPTWAGVTITATATDTGDDCNLVTISYDMGSDPNRVRAFALEISLTGDANIGAVEYVHPEYHVYPGSIQISGGQVTAQGSPVASSTVNSMIVEMGSLYAATDPVHTTQPGASGMLLQFRVANDEACDVVLALNAIRGEVVLEDTSIQGAAVTLVGCSVAACGAPAGPCDPPGCKGNLTGADNIINQTDMMAVYQRLGQHGATWTGDPAFKYAIVPSEALWHDCGDVAAPADVINQTDMMAIYQKLGMHGATWTGDPALKYVIPCNEIVW